MRRSFVVPLRLRLNLQRLLFNGPKQSESRPAHELSHELPTGRPSNLIGRKALRQRELTFDHTRVDERAKGCPARKIYRDKRLIASC